MRDLWISSKVDQTAAFAREALVRGLATGVRPFAFAARATAAGPGAPAADWISAVATLCGGVPTHGSDALGRS